MQVKLLDKQKIMKNIKLVLLMLVTVFISAQELDNEFLESLPDDVREDIEKRKQQKVDGTAEQYRPYIYSSKLSQVETFLKLKDRLEADLLELERRISNDEIDISSDLKVYGLDFFNTFIIIFIHKINNFTIYINLMRNI